MYTQGQAVVVKGLVIDFKRIDQKGVIVSKVPYETHYYRVMVNGCIQVVNDSMLVVDVKE